MTGKEQIVREIGDGAAGIVTIAALAEGVPIALGLLGCGWFLLRFANFVRVNVLRKEPWHFS